MTAHTTAVERIARVLAGRELSANADGAELSAGESVSALWQEHADDALSILKVLREPDPVMAEAGDAAIWQRMVEAAIAAEEGRDRFDRCRFQSCVAIQSSTTGAMTVRHLLPLKMP